MNIQSILLAVFRCCILIYAYFVAYLSMSSFISVAELVALLQLDYCIKVRVFVYLCFGIVF